MTDKYELLLDDWNNMSNVELKMKAQSIIASFIIIKNTISSISDPDLTQNIDNQEKEILKYIDHLLSL